MAMSLFKIRASAAGKIMTKVNDDALPATAKSYCKEWVDEVYYNKYKIINTNPIKKGIMCEQQAINLLGIHLDQFLFKNCDYLENDFCTGTYDTLTEDNGTVIDTKCIWSYDTFKKIKSPAMGYIFQLQAYMSLLGISKAKLAYIYIDTPVALVDDEFHRNNKGLSYDDFLAMHRPIISDDERIKIFDIERDDEIVTQLNARVVQCRDYIKELIAT